MCLRISVSGTARSASGQAARQTLCEGGALLPEPATAGAPWSAPANSGEDSPPARPVCRRLCSEPHAGPMLREDAARVNLYMR